MWKEETERNTMGSKVIVFERKVQLYWTETKGIETDEESEKIAL